MKIPFCILRNRYLFSVGCLSRKFLWPQMKPQHSNVRRVYYYRNSLETVDLRRIKLCPVQTLDLLRIKPFSFFLSLFLSFFPSIHPSIHLFLFTLKAEIRVESHSFPVNFYKFSSQILSSFFQLSHIVYRFLLAITQHSCFLLFKYQKGTFAMRGN